MARLLDADDLIAELEAACMPIHEKGISGIPGDNSSIADIINSLHSEKENEPAPAATGTSSTKKENTFQIDDSTKSDICQVLASAMSTLLALRQEMEPHEKKAFDLGETYKDICCASALMSSVRKGGDGK
jgi:hypothetical protein